MKISYELKSKIQHGWVSSPKIYALHTNKIKTNFSFNDLLFEFKNLKRKERRIIPDYLKITNNKDCDAKFEAIFITLTINNNLNSAKENIEELNNYLGKDIFDENNKHFEFIFNKEDFDLSIDSDRLAYDVYGNLFPKIFIS